MHILKSDAQCLNNLRKQCECSSSLYNLYRRLRLGNLAKFLLGSVEREREREEGNFHLLSIPRLPHPDPIPDYFTNLLLSWIVTFLQPWRLNYLPLPDPLSDGAGATDAS